jgi:hypothetical protein
MRITVIEGVLILLQICVVVGLIRWARNDTFRSAKSEAARSSPNHCEN